MATVLRCTEGLIGLALHIALLQGYREKYEVRCKCLGKYSPVGVHYNLVQYIIFMGLILGLGGSEHKPEFHYFTNLLLSISVDQKLEITFI